MIFVTLGSQKFQFNRLLKKIDELIAKEIIKDKVFAQIGYSDYQPEKFEYVNFMDRQTYSDAMKSCDMVITHGGTGAIIGAVKEGKKVIAVPRLEKYGEHVDNHQLQIINQFEEMGIIQPSYEIEELEYAIKEAKYKTYLPYISNTDKIIKNIECFLNSI